MLPRVLSLLPVLAACACAGGARSAANDAGLAKRDVSAGGGRTSAGSDASVRAGTSGQQGGASGKSSASGNGGGTGNAGRAAAGSGGSSASGGAGHVGAGGASGSRGGAGSGGGGGTGGGSGSGASGNGTGGGPAAGAGGGGGSVSYSTNFDLTESPISEGGAWHHDGLDWTLVETANGIARGTQALGVARSGPGQYNDSYAYLSGFPPDQQASAVIHLGNIDGSCTHEVEILLRWSDATHSARGYECNLAYDGSYAQIVRWNGAVGDFTYLANGTLPGGVHDGDTISAAITGDKISLSVNGVERANAQDSSFASGNPGIGLWRGSSGCGALGDYGFTSYTASAR